MKTSEPSFQPRRRSRPGVAAALAVLGIGAASFGLRSPVALAEPTSTSAPAVMATPQSVSIHTADADTDVGPGQAEPVLVGSP
jgi:hypothetical protein